MEQPLINILRKIILSLMLLYSMQLRADSCSYFKNRIHIGYELSDIGRMFATVNHSVRCAQGFVTYKLSPNIDLTGSAGVNYTRYTGKEASGINTFSRSLHLGIMFKPRLKPDQKNMHGEYGFLVGFNNVRMQYSYVITDHFGNRNAGQLSEDLAFAAIYGEAAVVARMSNAVRLRAYINTGHALPQNDGTKLPGHLPEFLPGIGLVKPNLIIRAGLVLFFNLRGQEGCNGL